MYGVRYPTNNLLAQLGGLRLRIRGSIPLAKHLHKVIYYSKQIGENMSNNITYILNESNVALSVSLEVDVDELEGCTVFETSAELKLAHSHANKGTQFAAELISIDEDETVTNFDGVLGTVDDDCSLEVYISSFCY